jgi:hypothetical protein
MARTKQTKRKRERNADTLEEAFMEYRMHALMFIHELEDLYDAKVVGHEKIQRYCGAFDADYERIKNLEKRARARAQEQLVLDGLMNLYPDLQY